MKAGTFTERQIVALLQNAQKGEKSFFDLGQSGMNSGDHRFQVLFHCTFVGLLAGKAQLMQDSPYMIAVMPAVEVPTDDLSYTEGCPAVIGKSLDLRTLDEQVLGSH